MTQLELARSEVKKKFKSAIWDSGFSQRDLVRIVASSLDMSVSETELSTAVNGGGFPKHEKIRKEIAKILQIEY